MGFPLTPSMTLDDLELLRSNSIGISPHFS